MNTFEEAKAYYSSIPAWDYSEGSYGLAAETGDEHDKLYLFKATIDLAGCKAELESTNVEEVLEKFGSLGDWATWTVKFEGLGLVHLHLYDLSGPGDAHTWAELWLEGEPFWEDGEPYECSWEQVASTISSLPEADRDRYLEFASKSDDLRTILTERGVIVGPPKP